MASNIYSEALLSHQAIFNHYGHEYEIRTKSAHLKYLQPFLDCFLFQLKGNLIVDLGCGPGRDLGYFLEQGLDAVGIDGSQGMVDICKSKQLPVLHQDFLSMSFDHSSIDGVWAYTSLTLIPKSTFRVVLANLAQILKKSTGILALGMIEGDGEGWKQDHKYDGLRRYVARYSRAELECVLSEYFGSVWITEERDPEKPERLYLHAICRNTPVHEERAAGQAAKKLFNSFASVYERRTQTGIALLEEERARFVELVGSGGRILDAGSGPGRDAKLFLEQLLQPVCIDISESNIELCQNKGLEAKVGDLLELGSLFPHHSFDGIWANCSITNWIPKKSLPGVLLSLKKLVKPGGTIFIGSVLGGFQGWEADEKYDGLPRYNTHWKREELLEELQVLGELVYARELSQEESKRKAYYNTIYSINV